MLAIVKKPIPLRKPARPYVAHLGDAPDQRTLQPNFDAGLDFAGESASAGLPPGEGKAKRV